MNQTTHDADRAVFDEREGIDDGLGPLYNAQACGECHQSPVSGGTSQVMEFRAGYKDQQGNFVPAAGPGGSSLIHSRAINAAIQVHCPDYALIRAQRRSPSSLGLGFVEAISDDELISYAAQVLAATGGKIAGTVVQVPVLEAAPNSLAVGRFGWKSQHASLLSFSADAYLNEMGITSRFLTTENTALGVSVASYDTVADPEDKPQHQPGSQDIDAFAQFMRASKAPPRDPATKGTAAALAGAQLFNQIGCAYCHRHTVTTAAPGTPLFGGVYVVPDALGNKTIHPYSDFLLHDIGTGDGIVQNGGQESAYRLRTPPLWGLRTSDRFLHDGRATTLSDAINAHKGEASQVLNNYKALGATDKYNLLVFLKSL